MNHFSHPQHKLSFVYSERLFKCDGCGQVGIGIRFNCSHCNFDLHTHCAAANPATAPLRHPFYPDCLFNFLACPPGDSRRYCDACGKDIVGFVYHCRKWGYDLHPCCAALPHEHHIDGGLRLRLHSRASAPCDWCSQMGKSWCYRSDCNKYNLHVACAMDLSMDSPHELLNGGGGSRRGGGCHSEGSGGGSGGRESDRGGRSRRRGGGGGRGGARGDGGGGDGGSVGRGGDRMAIVLENRIPRSRGGGGVGRDSGGGSRGNGRGHGNQDRNRGNHGDGSGGGRRGGGKRGDGGRGRGGHDGDQSNRGGGRGNGSVSGDGSHSSGSGGHGADRGGRGRGRGSGGRGVGSRRGDRGHGSGSHGGDRAEGGGGSSHDEGGGGRGSNGGVIRSVGNNHHGGKVKKLCKLAAVVGHFVIAAVLGDPSAMIVGVVSALLSQ